MRLLRMVGVLLAAVFAFCVVGVSVASASEPEFKPATKQEFTFTAGTTVLAATGNIVTCKAGAGTGEISGTDTIANVHVSYSGCSITTSSGTCTISSATPLGTEGLVDINTLRGNLGTVRTAEAASGVGLLLEPNTGVEFTTLKGTTCSVETKVTGKLAGEVVPPFRAGFEFLLTWRLNAGKQAIKEIDVLNKGFIEIPTLKAFGSTATKAGSLYIAVRIRLEVT